MKGDTDHPRSRGVYAVGLAIALTACGSSPLARGLLGAHLERYPEDGIIPARAGFTRRSVPCGCPWWDHPRSRGVYTPERKTP